MRRARGGPVRVTVAAALLAAGLGGSCGGSSSETPWPVEPVDAMRAVLREKIAGDGGQIGQALIKTLRAGVEKQEASRQVG